LRRKTSTTDLLTEVRNDLIEARHHFEVYRTYMHKRTRQKYRELFLVYRDFFMCGLRGHFAAMVVALGHVFDGDPKNISIASILKAAPNLEKTEGKKLARVRKIWDEHAIHLRHEVVAHRPGSSTIYKLAPRQRRIRGTSGGKPSSMRPLVSYWAGAVPIC
jgi:AbiU2